MAAVLVRDLGRHLGIPVSQNAAGHMLGRIEDTHEVGHLKVSADTTEP